MANKIKDAYDIGKDDDRDELVQTLRQHYQQQQETNKYKYAIIRFSNTGQGPTYRERLKNEINWDVDYICFHSKFMNLRDINAIVKNSPTKMTIIEVYHSLRAGIQLDTTNIFLVQLTYLSHISN